LRDSISPAQPAAKNKVKTPSLRVKGKAQAKLQS
jgi:hypothetical protein